MIDTIQDSYKKIVVGLGEDLARTGLVKTPERAAKAMLDCCNGYNMNINDIVNNAIFPLEAHNHDQVVTVKGIEFYSLCEHHLMPFFGQVNISYIPNEKILGLSKFARITDMFSHRLQTQENLTLQIAETISNITGAKGVGVVIEGQHLCMKMRGIEKQNSSMVTYTALGCYNETPEVKRNFFTLLR